jgi:GT2 family glycosyltransferase
MECLSCLTEQTYKNITVTIVDDGSTDGTFEKVKVRFPEVNILRGDGNLWWTGAMHMGVEHIMRYAKESDFILSLNNDVVFGTDFIYSLVKISEQHDRAIVGSMEKDYSNREEILYTGEWLNWDGYKFDVQRSLPDDPFVEVNKHVNVLPGRGLLIPIEVFNKIGNFNKYKCPHYIADYEFTMRAFNSGISLFLSYKSVIYSKRELTGISLQHNMRLLSLKEAHIHFFSKKSMSNIRDHINFVQLQCPQKYKSKNISIIILGALLRLKLTYPVHILFSAYRVLKKFGKKICYGIQITINL